MSGGCIDRELRTTALSGKELICKEVTSCNFSLRGVVEGFLGVCKVLNKF